VEAASAVDAAAAQSQAEAFARSVLPPLPMPAAGSAWGIPLATTAGSAWALTGGFGPAFGFGAEILPQAMASVGSAAAGGSASAAPMGAHLLLRQQQDSAPAFIIPAAAAGHFAVGMLPTDDHDAAATAGTGDPMFGPDPSAAPWATTAAAPGGVARAAGKALRKVAPKLKTM
jgi:hypothetical protein